MQLPRYKGPVSGKPLSPPAILSMGKTMAAKAISELKSILDFQKLATGITFGH